MRLQGLATWGWTVLSVSIMGCSSIQEHSAEDLKEVEAAIRPRLNNDVRLALFQDDDGSIPSEVSVILKDELTEENAIKVAVVNNRDLRAAYGELGIARADLVQAGLFTNPVFSANAKFFRSGTEIELGLSQSFLEAFYIPLRRHVALAELEGAKAAVSGRIVSFVFDVRRALIEVRAAQEAVDMRKRQLAAAESSFQLMSRLHQAGNVTDPQLTVEEVALTRARMELADAEASTVEARESLSTLLGLWGAETGWRVSGDLGEEIISGLDLDHVERRAVASSFDLAWNRSQTDALAQRAGLSSWEGVLPVGEIGPVAKQESGGRSWGFGPGGALSIPLFDYGQARAAGAGMKLRQAIDRHVSLAVKIRSAARRLRDRLTALAGRATYSKIVHLPVRARLVRETLQNFNAMQIGVFDVLQARQQEIQAEQDHLQTLRRAWLARIDLEELLAGSLNPSSLGVNLSGSDESYAPEMKKGH